MPTLGNMPVDRIHQSDVLACLTPIWTTKQETARRVRQRIRAVLRWATAPMSAWCFGVGVDGTVGRSLVKR